MLDGADFCEKCGGKLDPEDDICPSCGARAGGLEHDHKKKEDKEKLREFLAEDTETPILEEVEKRNPVFYVVVVLAGLLLISVMIAGIYFNKNPSGTVPIKQEDLSTIILGSWRASAADISSPRLLEFFPDGKYRVTDETSKSTIIGTYRFPKLNEIEMTSTGRSHGVLTVTMHRGELVLITPAEHTVSRYKRVSIGQPSPGATSAPSPEIALIDPVGRWKVIKVDVQGKDDGQKKHWERVTLEIIQDKEGRMIWRNLDTATGAPQAVPDGSPKIITFLELEMKEG